MYRSWRRSSTAEIWISNEFQSIVDGGSAGVREVGDEIDRSVVGRLFGRLVGWLVARVVRRVVENTDVMPPSYGQFCLQNG